MAVVIAFVSAILIVTMTNLASVCIASSITKKVRTMRELE
jgi:hypothetical protein